MALTKVKGSGLATGAATDSLVGIDDNATSTKLTISDTNITGVGAFTSTSIDATKLSGALPAIDGSALTGVGKVLQVLKTGWTSSATVLVSGTPIKLMSLSITTQANSKVLVFMSTGQTDNSGAGTNPLCHLSVDGVQFSGNTNHWFYGVDSRAVINMQGLSGALTAGTHTVEMWGGSYNGTISYNYQTSQQGSLIVMEIGV